ncbi:MAG: hypothetical protein OEM46_10760 [Ignavibacteria bacterium]|nr:hypothetical protein [Ignavibacteria bacterium]
MLSNYKKRLIYKPQKIQLSLTIRFTAFFIIVAGLIYFYFSQKFEEEVLDKFTFKSEIMANFLEGNPQFFVANNIEDKTQLLQLMILNEVLYLVIEDQDGRMIDAIHLDVAEYYLYVAANNNDNISFDETTYRVVLPLMLTNNSIGKVYLGLKAGLVATDLKKKKLLTALFSLSILLAGIVFTYFQYRFIRLFLQD